MEQQYSDIQKAALVSLLIEMVNADRRIDLEEVRVLNHICRELNIDSDTFTCGRGLIYKAAIVIASRMSEEKKIHAAKALVRIIDADNEIDPNELRLLNEICEATGIDLVFD